MQFLYNHLQDIFEYIAYLAWSPISILLLVGTGLWLTIQFKCVQLRYFKYAFKILIYGHPSEHQKDISVDLAKSTDITGSESIEPIDKSRSFSKAVSEDISEVVKPKSQKLSGFQVLSTVLSGTIGTGNIAGVATAIVMGGPGALFWMWITAFLGMATKFTSCSLAHYYRQKDSSNNILGGPMITLSQGLGYNKLAKMFAVFMILGTLSTGSMVQANSIVDGTAYLLPDLADHRLLLGVVIALLAGIVIIGGVKRIANVATIIVPFMAGIYVLTAVVILILHYSEVPKTFKMIFEYAFSLKAISGASFWLVIRSGVARGLFASEAGLGTAPIALATLNTKSSLEAGFIGMLSPMIDTLLICTMTGLIIIASGAYDPTSVSNLSGAPLSQQAFATGFNCISSNSSVLAAWMVGIGLTLFAFTTILTWSYYGDRCVSFLLGEKFVLPYRILFILILILGSILKLEIVWNLADIANAGMAIPNLIAVFLLRHKVMELFKKFANNY